MQPDQCDANAGQPDQITMDEATADLKAVSAIIDEIVAVWRPDPEVKTKDYARARFVVALAAEAIESAHATRVLLQHRLATNAATTARRAFEFGVTAAWVQSEKGAVEAMAKKGSYEVGKLARALVREHVPIPGRGNGKCCEGHPRPRGSWRRL